MKPGPGPDRLCFPMKYRLFVCLGLAALAACAGPREADPRAAAEAAMDQAMRMPEPPQPVPLPTLDPPTRLQSELEAMSHAERARWALPAAEARDIVASDLLRGMMPRPGGIALYRQPRATAQPGVCELQGYEVWLRVPNENSLTYRQHLDPPLQPFQYQPLRRWKVIGSTDASRRQGPPDCAAARPYGQWFDGPSAAAVHRAAWLVEQAQQRPASLRIVCRQMRYEETRQDFATPECPNPRALLERLTPELINRVRPADCTLAASRRGCIGIEYHDPAAPGSHSFYLVTVPDEDRPDYIQITQGMLPPH